MQTDLHTKINRQHRLHHTQRCHTQQAVHVHVYMN